MADIAHAVNLIDDTLDAVRPRCVQCRHILGNSPSDFWCSDMCQRVWHQNRADKPTPASGLRLEYIHVDIPPTYAPSAYPPGLFESLWNHIRNAWRKR